MRTLLWGLSPTEVQVQIRAEAPASVRRLRVVAFLQERTTRRIIGAASTRIQPNDEPRQ